MKTIRFKESKYLLISVNDVCNYIQEKHNLTDKQIKKISWDFKKIILKDTLSDFQRGEVYNMLLIPSDDDFFLSWTRFHFLETMLRKKGCYEYDLFHIIASPNEIYVSNLFKIIP
jgi:hypothetical protein